MLNLVWNSTLNRLGAGAVWFYIATNLPGGVDYFSALGLAALSTGTTTLFEGALFVICSYFLGNVMVGLGRANLWRRDLSWIEEFALASKTENTFLQTAMMSYVDRSDAFAGLGATLFSFFPMMLFYLLNWDFVVTTWLFFALIIGLLLLECAKREHSEAKRLLARYNAVSVSTP